MAITSDLDNIVKWFEEEVCPGILLKVPDDKVNDGGYNVQTAHPAAFAMYIPTQDRKPPDVAAPIPSLCVQLLKGKHAPAQHIGQMTIQLALATWNPGQHGSEMAVPEQDPQALGGVKYRREPSENFKRNLEGWRDVWSFTDKVLQAIENTEYPSFSRFCAGTFGDSPDDRPAVDPAAASNDPASAPIGYSVSEQRPAAPISDHCGSFAGTGAAHNRNFAADHADYIGSFAGCDRTTQHGAPYPYDAD